MLTFEHSHRKSAVQQQSSLSSSNRFTIEHDVSTRKLGPSSGMSVKNLRLFPTSTKCREIAFLTCQFLAFLVTAIALGRHNQPLACSWYGCVRQIVGPRPCAATSDDEVATQVPKGLTLSKRWLHSRQGTRGERYSLHLETELLYWTNYLFCWTNYHSESAGVWLRSAGRNYPHSKWRPGNVQIVHASLKSG